MLLYLFFFLFFNVTSFFSQIFHVLKSLKVLLKVTGRNLLMPQNTIKTNEFTMIEVSL